MALRRLSPAKCRTKMSSISSISFSAASELLK
uniref:Uncharacterized protein n=1 Tax=Arundo donax TaxID=35708 RepID=A0A0A9C320_ARUDO